MSKDQTLDERLRAARNAPRATRIEHRDGIAAFGIDAIDAIRSWMGEPEYAAFAIRVVAKAGQLGAQAEAASALQDARSDSSGLTLGDIDAALSGLGARPRPTAPAIPADTQPINESLYEHLVDAARAGQTMTYSQAGAVIGLTMRNPHHRRVLGQHLGVISAAEVERGRPMLSALVVHKGEKSLGTGFAQLGKEIGEKRAVEDDASFAARELQAVFAFWGRPSAPTAGGSPTGARGYRTRHDHEEPPPAIGACGFSTATGQCLNPGRWDRDGTLSCTTHALASEPVPYPGVGSAAHEPS